MMTRNETRVLTTFCYDHHDFVIAASLAQRLEPDWLALHPMGTGDNVFLDLLNGPVAAIKSMLVR